MLRSTQLRFHRGSAWRGKPVCARSASTTNNAGVTGPCAARGPSLTCKQAADARKAYQTASRMSHADAQKGREGRGGISEESKGRSGAVATDATSAYLRSSVGQRVFFRGQLLEQALKRNQLPFGVLISDSLPSSPNKVKVETIPTGGARGAQDKVASITTNRGDIVGGSVPAHPRLDPDFMAYLRSRVGKGVALQGDALRVAAALGARAAARLKSINEPLVAATVELVPGGNTLAARFSGQSGGTEVMVSLPDIVDVSHVQKLRLVRVPASASLPATDVPFAKLEQKVCRLACEGMSAMVRTGPASDYPGRSAVQAGFCRSCASDGSLPDDTTWRAALATALGVVTRVREDNDVRYLRFACPSEVVQEGDALQLADEQCHSFLLLIEAKAKKNRYYMTTTGLPLMLKAAILQVAGGDLYRHEGIYAAVDWGDIAGWGEAVGFFTNLHFVCKRIDDTAVRNVLTAAFSRGYELSTGDLNVQPASVRAAGAGCGRGSGDADGL